MPIWQVVEYFSNYFQQPIFGHPSALAHYVDGGEDFVSDTGVDARVYFVSSLCKGQGDSQYHTSLLSHESDTIGETTRSLLIYMRNGLFFQYLYNSLGSVKVNYL